MTARIMLKLSGEIFAGEGNRGYNLEAMGYFAQEIIDAYQQNPGVQIAIMPGGGNHGRGSEIVAALSKDSDHSFDPTYAHLAAMCFLNGNMLIAKGFLQPRLIEHGIKISILTSFTNPSATAKFEPFLGQSKLDDGKLLIIGGGSGLTNLTTDTAAAIISKSLACARVLKGTKVDGVFTGDPRTKQSVELLPRMRYKEFIERNLSKIFDRSGIMALEELNMPLQIFNFFTPGNLAKVIRGEDIGTLITNE